MNPQKVAQMNAENVEAIHWLTWPIRFIIDLIKTAIFLVVFIVAVPLIFAGLVIHFIVTGHSVLDADSVLALKVIFSFVAPFAVSIVYRLIQWYLLYSRGEPARRDAVRRSYKFSHHRVFFITLALMALGTVVAFPWWDGMSTELGLGTLVIYLTSPLLLLLVRRRFPDYPRQKDDVPSFARLAQASRNPRFW